MNERDTRAGGAPSRWEQDDRLDPVRFRLPRPRRLLRLTLIAVLLALAATVLFLEPPPAARECPPAGQAGPSRAGQASPAAASESPAGRGKDAVPPVPDGKVGVPIHLADPATAAVLRAGDRVDVMARGGVAQPSAAPASETEPQGVVLVRDALVLATAAHGDVVYLAMDPEHARRVARLPPDVAIGVTVNPR